MSKPRRTFLKFLLACSGLTVTEPPTLGGVLHALSRSEYDEVSDAKFEVVESGDGFSLRTQKYAGRFRRAEIPQLPRRET